MVVESLQSYKKPPIIEAVIELRFASPISIKDAEKSTKKLNKYYDVCLPETQIKAQIDAKEMLSPPETQISQKKTGFKLTSLDQSKITRVTLDYINIAQLAPYPGWQIFSERARRDWQVFHECVGHQKINRVGVRFLNRIDVPVSKENPTGPNNYVNIFPHMPELGPDKIDSYAMQIRKPLNDEDFHVTITSATTSSPVPNSVSIILDVDVVVSRDIPAKDNDLWLLIDRIRGYKNMVFEACITDRSRELFSK